MSNNFKSLEQIQLEGVFKLRKILSSRSQIPEFDPLPVPLQDNLNVSNDAFGDNTQVQTEALPAKIDFNQDVNYANQVLSYNSIKSVFDINKFDDTELLESKNNMRSNSKRNHGSNLNNRDKRSDSQGPPVFYSEKRSQLYNFSAKRESTNENNPFSMVTDTDDEGKPSTNTPANAAQVISMGSVKRSNKFNQYNNTNAKRESKPNSINRMFSPSSNQILNTSDTKNPLKNRNSIMDVNG